MTNQNDAAPVVPSATPHELARRDLVFGLLIMLSLLSGLIFYVGRWQTCVASVSWPTTGGIIRASEIVEDEGAEFAKITYSYSVSGSQFESDRIRVEDVCVFWASDGARMYVQRNPVNAVATVHYNPTDPNIAILEPGLDGNAVARDLPVIAFFLFVGFAKLAQAIRKLARVSV